MRAKGVRGRRCVGNKGKVRREGAVDGRHERVESIRKMSVKDE